ncbi:MAG: acyl-CoA thioesterase [bacterium]|jgi:acyl-CoA thioester hydrolase
MNDNSHLSGFPVVVSIPLHWGEQDPLGHMNNVAYLRWAETARVDYLIRVGVWESLKRDGIGPILANVNCDYRRPLTYPDTVLIGTRVDHLGNSSMRMVHRMVSTACGEVAADVSSVLVIYDYKVGKPVRIPDDIREAIARIEASADSRAMGV